MKGSACTVVHAFNIQLCNNNVLLVATPQSCACSSAALQFKVRACAMSAHSISDNALDGCQGHQLLNDGFCGFLNKLPDGQD